MHQGEYVIRHPDKTIPISPNLYRASLPESVSERKEISISASFLSRFTMIRTTLMTEIVLVSLAQDPKEKLYRRNRKLS